MACSKVASKRKVGNSKRKRKRVFSFLGKIISTLAELSGVQLPMGPAVHLLNDDSHLSLIKKTCKVWLSGLTAAKGVKG